MMTEKTMVNDALNNINSALTSYASAISQTENTNLRSTLIKMRDQAENSQYDLYQIAKKLNYYVAAQQASQEEIMKVKSLVLNCESKPMNHISPKDNSEKVPYLSAQSNGLLEHMDTHTQHALQAPPKSKSITLEK